MNIQDNSLLSTSLTADSGWTDISHFEDWSLFVDKLESGATVTVYAKNASGKASDQTDTTTGAFVVATITSSGAPGFVGAASCKDASGNVVTPHFILVKKTQGGSPAATIVQFYGRQD